MSLSDHIRRLEQEEAFRVQSETARAKKVAEGEEILSTRIESIRTDIEQFLSRNGFKRPAVWSITGTTYEHEKFNIPVFIRYANEDGLKIHLAFQGRDKGHISVEKFGDGELLFGATCENRGNLHRQVQKALDMFFD